MPLAKEAGFILSIDQASNAAGAALFKDGVLYGSSTLYSNHKSDPIGARLVAIVDSMDCWLDKLEIPRGKIKTVLFEGVKSSLVLCTIGAFLTSPHIRHVKISTKNFIGSSRWKKWARDHGAKAEKFADIKGIVSLRETGLNLSVKTDDEADAVMQYKAWADL